MEQLWNSGLHWNIMNHEWSVAGACKVIMNKWWIPRVVESKSGPAAKINKKETVPSILHCTVRYVKDLVKRKMTVYQKEVGSAGQMMNNFESR